MINQMKIKPFFKKANKLILPTVMVMEKDGDAIEMDQRKIKLSDNLVGCVRAL